MRCEPNVLADYFQCTQCGECCRGFGGTYVSDDDIKAIAEYLGVQPDIVLKRYCVRSGSKPLICQGEDSRCIFWDQLCTIHPVKPRMCRMWPFIPSLLVDAANWQIMAASCPGINPKVDPKRLQAIVADCLGVHRPDDTKGSS